MRRSFRLLFLLPIVASLVLAGCSGSAGTATKSEAATATGAAPTTEVVRETQPPTTTAAPTTTPPPTTAPPTTTWTPPLTYAPTTPPPDLTAKKIVFAAKSGAHSQIYAINDDGSGLVNISNSAADDMTPRWTPKRDKILFARLAAGEVASSIYSMSPDGSTQTRLAQGSSSGARIWAARDPSFNAAGDMLYYALGEVSSTGTIVNTLMGVLALGRSPMTGGTVDTGGKYNDSAPSLSPDEKKVAFASTRNGGWDIYASDSLKTSIVAVGTRNIMTVEMPAVARLTTNADGTQVRWSPDGTKLVYSSGMRVGGKYVYQIFVMSADGTNQTNISNSTSTDTVPDWSPDGSRIAFLSDRDGSQQLYVMSADGSNVKKLTSTAGTKDSLSWR